jgi:glycosyltransferase involved in cell wall biosynthesis
VFVFASSCENMPNILLEAMSAGLPIACSDRGPMPEILGEGGCYFDPESVDAATEAIERLVVSPETRARCAQIAFRRASAYSWERCADETMRFLASFPIASRRAS